MEEEEYWIVYFLNLLSTIIPKNLKHMKLLMNFRIIDEIKKFFERDERVICQNCNNLSKLITINKTQYKRQHEGTFSINGEELVDYSNIGTIQPITEIITPWEKRCTHCNYTLEEERCDVPGITSEPNSDDKGVGWTFHEWEDYYQNGNYIGSSKKSIVRTDPR